MHVLVVGATGLPGTEICRRAIDAGHQVLKPSCFMELGGPEPVSPADVVRMFEEERGEPIPVELAAAPGAIRWTWKRRPGGTTSA